MTKAVTVVELLKKKHSVSGDIIFMSEWVRGEGNDPTPVGMTQVRAISKC